MLDRWSGLATYDQLIKDRLLVSNSSNFVVRLVSSRLGFDPWKVVRLDLFIPWRDWERERERIILKTQPAGSGCCLAYESVCTSFRISRVLDFTGEWGSVLNHLISWIIYPLMLLDETLRSSRAASQTSDGLISLTTNTTNCCANCEQLQVNRLLWRALSLRVNIVRLSSSLHAVSSLERNCSRAMVWTRDRTRRFVRNERTVCEILARIFLSFLLQLQQSTQSCFCRLIKHTRLHVYTAPNRLHLDQSLETTRTTWHAEQTGGRETISRGNSIEKTLLNWK